MRTPIAILATLALVGLGACSTMSGNSANGGMNVQRASDGSRSPQVATAAADRPIPKPWSYHSYPFGE